MKHQRKMIGGLASMMLLLGTASGIATAAVPMAHSTSQGEFERIEQPLGMTLSVAAGGVFLIGLELWWFLLSKPNAK